MSNVTNQNPTHKTGQERRGAGRSMALLLAAQMAASSLSRRPYSGQHGRPLVVVWVHQNTDFVAQWLHTLHPQIAENIRVFSRVSLEDGYADCTRGLNVVQHFVDHHLLEKAEEDLERQIAALRKRHATRVQPLQSIR